MTALHMIIEVLNDKIEPKFPNNRDLCPNVQDRGVMLMFKIVVYKKLRNVWPVYDLLTCQIIEIDIN